MPEADGVYVSGGGRARKGVPRIYPMCRQKPASRAQPIRAAKPPATPINAATAHASAKAL